MRCWISSGNEWPFWSAIVAVVEDCYLAFFFLGLVGFNEEQFQAWPSLNRKAVAHGFQDYQVQRLFLVHRHPEKKMQVVEDFCLFVRSLRTYRNYITNQLQFWCCHGYYQIETGNGSKANIIPLIYTDFVFGQAICALAVMETRQLFMATIERNSAWGRITQKQRTCSYMQLHGLCTAAYKCKLQQG